MIKKYTDDDYCDLYENKLCDNCGKCLEEDGIDIRAIKIEDIAKNIEENKFLEEEWKNMIAKAQNIDPTLDKEDLEKALKEAYSSLKIDENTFNSNIESKSEEKYIDAFEFIEYLDEADLLEDTLEEETEEIFPGVRRLIKKNNQ
ncbi:hypothetical protein K5V21_09260 [Clostridium sardiniense]|uniref:Uncharacterized protein n=1 Tax=Clostridium sardiniense TaxID=29369 RepID=A0ABS7KXV6_CLOSR|nr:hypothetical protein [Clostridium sardiniense]MBY0755648.1 hypothetical protein [Clostridium sardiniense]MDQ0461818.1 Fe-S-cluster containining protein [Clostridium sardiniense]